MMPRCSVAVKTSTVVMIAPTSVTNITGFLSMARGCSLRNASPMAGTTIFESNSDGGLCVMGSKKFALRRQKMFDDGPESQRRKISERANEQNRADEQDGERDAGNREGADALRRDFFLRERTRSEERRVGKE